MRLESAPLALEPEDSISPVVTDVSSNGLISLGFPEMMLTSPAMFADPAPSAIRSRRFLSREIIDATGVKYEVFDAINIRLTSSEFDDIEPVKVDWSLKNFNGQEAEI